MATIGTIAVKLTAITSDFMSGLNKAASSVKAFSANASNSTNGLGRSFDFLHSKWTMLLSGFGVSVGFGALVSLTKNAFTAIDAMDELASKTGLSVEKLQALQYAAKFSGVSADQLTTAILKMQKTIVSGSKYFDAAGMDVNELLGMDAAAQLGAIADRISTLGSATERTAFATAMFGKAGAHLLAFLEGGAQGIGQLEGQLQDMGLAFNSLDAAKVAIAADGIDNMKTALGAVFNQIAIQISPVIVDLSNRFMEWATTGSNAGSMVSSGIQMVINYIGMMADRFHGMGRVFKFVYDLIMPSLININNALENWLNKALGGVEGHVASLGVLWFTVFGAMAKAAEYITNTIVGIAQGIYLAVGGAVLFLTQQFNKFLGVIQGALNKLVEFNNYMMGLAGNEGGKLELFKEITIDDSTIEGMKDNLRGVLDDISDPGSGAGDFFGKMAEDAKKQIDAMNEEQKPSAELDQWWASINDKLDDQAAHHENILQMEDDGLDLEKLKTQEKEKQKKIEQGGFLISKFGRTAFGADTTFDNITGKVITKMDGDKDKNKDERVVSELEEQTGYLRILASKPQVASFA